MMDLVVELENGLIRGLVEKHEDGFDYYAFKGIPYGKPPIGELRFKDPVPLDNWSGILDCTRYGSLGVQTDRLLSFESYSEDCLNLNIFTRSLDPTANITVIVVIFTQDLYSGYANDQYCGPDYLIRKNVVLVTVNFRMGILGFLSLEDKIAPGNQGIKDILMALQWIQQNIQVFGGNRNNVTLLGLAGAGVLTHYLALSPLSRGLFHKVIHQGSVSFSQWTIIKNAKQSAIKLCSLLGKKIEIPAEILKFLKTIDCKRLLKAQNILLNTVWYMPFGPVVDATNSSNPVIPIDECVNQGIHLPCLIGQKSKHSLWLLAGKPREEYFKICDVDSDKITIFGIERFLDGYNLNAMQLKQLYYKNETMSGSDVDIFVDLISEVYFIDGIHKYLKIQAEESSTSTYFYRFNYYSQELLSNLILKDIPRGAGIFDEALFLFKMNIYTQLGGTHFLKNTQSYKLMDQMTEMWTNFAKYGRPTVVTSDLLPVHWLPVNDGTILRYLNIDKNLAMQSTENIEQKFLSAKDIQI